jgi:hypothetical protein
MFGKSYTKKILILAPILIILYLWLFGLPPYIPSYLNPLKCILKDSTEICRYDLHGDWEQNQCPFGTEDSLVYSIRIITNKNGSLVDFICRTGPMYALMNLSRPHLVIQACDAYTAELIDSAVKGRNTTPVPYVKLAHDFPDDLTDYTYSILFCKNFTEGQTTKYLITSFIDYSGVLYR